MIVAQELKNINIRKAFKQSLNSNYSYCIFNMSMPLKLYKDNLKSYDLHNNHKEIGVILNNSSFLNKNDNDVLFKNKKALAQSFQNKIILKLIQPEDYSFLSWIKTVQPHIIKIMPSFIMLPVNKSLNISKLSNCILAIQEFNSILVSFIFTSEVVFYQQREKLSSLSYLINNVGFPSKTSLCLDIDFMEKDFYTLKDILNDIIKFDIINKISMIKTNKYTLKDESFKEFIDSLKDDVIVFGENI